MEKKVILGITLTFTEEVKEGQAKEVAQRVLDAITQYVNHSESGIAPEDNLTQKITIVGSGFTGMVEKYFAV